MALKATIHKARLQLSDMDRGVYVERALTIARHPSETDERMMIRLLAYALHTPADERDGALDFSKGLWDTDEPDLWLKDLTGTIRHWIDVGQPDERRMLRAASRADRVTVIGYASSTPTWWKGVANKLSRVRNVDVWQVPADESHALGALAERTMQLDVLVQDGTASVGSGETLVNLTPVRLAAT